MQTNLHLHKVLQWDWQFDRKITWLETRRGDIKSHQFAILSRDMMTRGCLSGRAAPEPEEGFVRSRIVEVEESSDESSGWWTTSDEDDSAASNRGKQLLLTIDDFDAVSLDVAIDVSSDSDECCCCDESPETDGDIAEPSVISGFGDGLVAAIATSIFCAKRGNVDTMYSLNFDNGDMSADDSFVTIHIIVDHLGLVKLSDDCWRPTLGVWRRCAGACGYAMRIVDAS